MRRLVRRSSLCLLLASLAGCALVTPLERRAPAARADYTHGQVGATAVAPSLDDATAEPATIAKSHSGDALTPSLAQNDQPKLPDDGPTPEQSRRGQLLVASLIVLAALIALFATL